MQAGLKFGFKVIWVYAPCFIIIYDILIVGVTYKSNLWKEISKAWFILKPYISLCSEILFMKILKNFKNFFQRRENIINVTIAIVLGAAINQVTNFFILDILWPLLKGLMQRLGFSFETLNQFFPERFLQALANLLLILALIYFLMARGEDK